MKKTQKEQAEKLQAKLEKLLQSKEKKQATFVKLKSELSDLSQSIDSTKLKLFEILQSGSDDMAFSNWAKRKINENGNSENGENAKSENHANANSAKSENATTPTTQNHNPHDKQNHHGKQNQQSQQSQNAPSHTG